MGVETFTGSSELEERELSQEELRENTAKIFEGNTREMLKKGARLASNAVVFGCDMQALFDKSGEVSNLTKTRNLASAAVGAIAWGLIFANQPEGATIAGITQKGIMAPELIDLLKGAPQQLRDIAQGGLQYFKDDLQPLQDSFRHMADILRQSPELITLNLNGQQSG